jgi:ribonucleoside-diphosphate reductase alpha chain
MYTYEEAYEKSLEYFNGNDLSASVFLSKYALRDLDGNLLEATPDDMHHRLAKEFARIEKKKFKEPYSEDEIYEFFKGFNRIVPQGSMMSAIGDKHRYTTCSNCYVLPSPHDSYLGINYLDTQIAQISARRGGCGWEMSTLRPKGLGVKNAAGSTTGVVSFMGRYSNTIREVCQAGRRGASLQSLHVKHPEILDFIVCKNDDKSITGSNISTQFNDEFMLAADNGEDFELQWPIHDNIPIISETINATKIWDTFIDSAWRRAEPGAIFIDTVHKYSTSAPYGERYKESSGNPCGEQMLPKFGKCLLICINLYNYVKNKFTKDAKFDFESFSQDVKIMQRLADDAVDLDIERMQNIIEKIKSDPEPDYIKQPGIDLWTNIMELSKEDRRTGCGIVGLADCLAALNLKYDTDQAITQCSEIMLEFKLSSYWSSVNMAKELGAFSVYEHELDKKSMFIQNLKNDDPKLYNAMKKYGRRNMTLLTVSPTGTVSLMTNTSSGLEPVFMLEYTRRKKINPFEDIKPDFIDQSGDEWIEFAVKHNGLQKWIDTTGDNDITHSPYYNACAHEIDYDKKVEMQAAIQKHIDNSISVTTNLPKDIDKETVSRLYKKAWRLGCKGFTIYVDGCRSGVLVNKEESELQKRPKELPCDVHHIQVNHKQYFVLVGLLDGEPYEIFAGNNNVIKRSVKNGVITRKKKGYYIATFEDGSELNPINNYMQEEFMEIISRLCSGLLRTNANISFIVDQLEKLGEKQDQVHSFAKCMSRAIKKYIEDFTPTDDICPNCNADLVRMEGCKTCPSCAYSHCL